MMRKGAFSSMVMVELAWLGKKLVSKGKWRASDCSIGVLWLLWLVTAAMAADKNSEVFISNCDYIYGKISRVPICRLTS